MQHFNNEHWLKSYAHWYEGVKALTENWCKLKSVSMYPPCKAMHFSHLFFTFLMP